MNSRKLSATLSSVFLLCTSFLSCTGAAGSGSLPNETLEIRTAAGIVIPAVIEIARTEKEQEKGYMGRKTIPDGTGMIFVYASDQHMHFWMKNTPYPLSIAFIDAAGTIREIYDMVPFSLATVSSIRSVRYALEVPAGWFTRTGIAAGDSFTAETLALLTEQ